MYEVNFARGSRTNFVRESPADRSTNELPASSGLPEVRFLPAENGHQRCLFRDLFCYS